MGGIYSFDIFQMHDPGCPIEMEYQDKLVAYSDRVKLLLQIEAYHSRGE
jgi:hypothetical protein